MASSNPQSSVKRSLGVVLTFHSLSAQDGCFYGLPKHDFPLPIPSLKYSPFLHNLAEVLSNLYPEITENFCILHFLVLVLQVGVCVWGVKHLQLTAG